MSNSTASMSSFSSVQSSVSSASVQSAQSSLSAAIASSVSSQILSASTVYVEPTTTNVVTSIVSASAAPPTTQLITSVVTAPPVGESSQAPITVIVTSVYSDPTPTAAAAATSAPSSSRTSSTASPTSSAATLQNNGSGAASTSSGLSAGGKTAVAVVVPVVVVALLVLLGLFFWRRRKQNKTAKEERRKEVEEYGYNPNNDPTLAAVAADGTNEMSEDHGNGYRGWGNNTVTSHRKASTTLSAGHTTGQLSDAGSVPGAYGQSSPTNLSDHNSGDGLMSNRRDTISSDDLGALGAAPIAGSHRTDIRRGPSNASSQYSAGNRSDDGSHPSLTQASIGQAYSSPDINNGGYGYGQHGPYGDGTYGGGVDTAMPVVRDVSARRNTRIEAGGSYQQGNSGIAQNF